MLPFESTVVAFPYRTVTVHILPKPAKLTVDEQGVLTLIDATDQKVMIQKPMKELKSVQIAAPEITRKLGAESVLIYVGLNEAYGVSFATDDLRMDGGVKIYKSLLKGDTKQATEVFNKVGNVSDMPDEEAQALSQKQTDRRETFVKIAQEAGVYTKFHRTLPALVFTIVAVTVAAVFVYYILSR